MSFAKKELCAICGALIPEGQGIKINFKKQGIIVCSEACKEKWEMIWKR
ncbi:unnamed protein product [marine sediment metagenome]|uniref:TRASH domain-containing protein n=1 Tax=marine sediment metagenome TaxID=412755 RepID=X0VXW4_9ZZZZ